MILLILLLSSALQNCFAYPNQYKSYKNYKLYKVDGDAQHVEEMFDVLDRVAHIADGYVRGSEGHFLVAPEWTSTVKEIAHSLDLDITVQIEDLSEAMRLEGSGSKRGPGFSWTDYYDVDDVYEFLRNMSKSNPDSTEVIVGGQTYEGRKLLGIRINTSTGKKNKPVVFIESGTHAREWITVATTTYFINQLLTSTNPNITDLRDQFDWRIFPTVNPDGYHYSFTTERWWRKTRSKTRNSRCIGVDPNRNWDYNWNRNGTSNDRCSQVYAGSEPFSEIETKSMSEYLLGINNLLAYLDFHSFGQYLFVPFSDTKDHSNIDNYDDLIQIGKTSIRYGHQVDGGKYRGPASSAELLYAASGTSFDWVRKTLNTRLVFTYELTPGHFVWPASKIVEQGEVYTQMVLGLFVEAKKLGYY